MTLVNVDKAPFPWFGGKSKAAPLVWDLLGDVEHYVEPFAGSLAVLLNRPHPCNRSYYSETVNDLDGFVVNAWRGIQMYPDTVAEAASWPVTEADKLARSLAILRWRTNHDLEHLMGDPTWCDPVIAGWWLWAVAVQIGAFHSNGPWTADPATGRIYKQARTSTREPGVHRQRPFLSGNGQGVNHASTREPGMSRERPHLVGNGQGVNHPGTREPGVSRERPFLGNDGQGVNRPQLREPGVIDDLEQLYHPTTMPELRRWMAHLAARLRHVRIVNGSWERVCTGSALWTISVRMGDGHVGVFLDPPYDNTVRADGLYVEDSGAVATDVRHWCIKNGDNPKNRIVLAGFDVEHQELETHGWTVHEWFTDGYLTGGMANDQENGEKRQRRERLWASPHCLTLDTTPAIEQLDLFG